MRDLNMRLTLLILFFLSICPQNKIFALEFVSPKFEVSEYKVGEFIVEQYYTFSEYVYKRQDISWEAKKSNYEFIEPEDVLIYMISAMRNLDIEWFLSCFEPRSRDYLRNRFLNDDRKNKYLVSWRDNYLDSKIRLIRRIDHGNISMIEYEANNGKNTTKLISIFEKIDGYWFRSIYHTDNPLYVYYMSGKDKIRITAE